jgi:cytochrome P450
VTIRAGEAVLPAINSANRDESAFADPAGLDLGRRPNPHVAFGYGIHHCVGAQLGRIELQVALAALLERMPALQLAVAEDALTWNLRVAFRRPVELPVTWSG